jgi:serine/threonine-protein kinase HipA
LPPRNAQILYKDRQAGTLVETADGGTRFSYAPTWQEAIACCFPIARREHEWAPGLHPFFEHLAPEGWLRQEQARLGHIAEQDDFGLLLRYGADCIGAVGIRPAAGQPEPPDVAEAAPAAGRTVSGVQKKLLVVRDGVGFRPTGRDGPAPFIAKFNPDNLPTLVRNEKRTLDLSIALLGEREVTEFTTGLVQGQEGGALIVTRFDRGPNGEKLRLEDFAQILLKPRGRDYRGKYNASYEDVAAVIQEHSARSAIDLARLLRRVILFALVGNCDGHLKNFSLLETPEGLRLSPAYDIVNTLLYENYDRELALPIGGNLVQLDAVTPQLLRAYGERIGIPQRAIEQVFSDIRRRANAQAFTDLLTPPQGEPPDGFVHRYADIVRGACHRILE